MNNIETKQRSSEAASETSVTSQQAVQLRSKRSSVAAKQRVKRAVSVMSVTSQQA